MGRPGERLTRSITKAAFSALRWNYVGFFARSGSSFVIGIFLARLLGPRPFGQLAAASLVIGIANIIADAGFSSALIQAPELTELQIRFVFTMQFVVALAMSLCCAASSGLVAAAFHDPAIRNVVLWTSTIFLLQAFGQTANALLRRELAFRSLQTAQLSSYFIGFLLVGIPLALRGAGVWSLVTAQLVQTAVFAGMLYWKVRHSVKPTLSSAGAVLLRFGAKVTLSNVINYGISNADNFVVGHSFGSLGLGYYNRAFTLANAPAEGIVGTMQQVLFASCSRAEGRLVPIRRAYLATLSAVSLAVVPAFCAMSVCPATVMLGLYGERWRPAVTLFQPLILALAIHTLMALAGPILGSLNRVEREVRAQAIGLGVALIVFWIAAKFSILALAWSVLAVYFVRFVLMTYPVLHVLGLPWRDVGRVLLGPLLLAGITSSAVYAMQKLAGTWHLPYAVMAALLLATGVGTFVLSLLCSGRWTVSAELQRVVRDHLPWASPVMINFALGPDSVFEATGPIPGGENPMVHTPAPVVESRVNL